LARDERSHTVDPDWTEHEEAIARGGEEVERREGVSESVRSTLEEIEGESRSLDSVASRKTF